MLIKKHVLRIEGSNSPDLSEEIKHPIILPSRCVFTRLVVLDYHTIN